MEATGVMSLRSYAALEKEVETLRERVEELEAENLHLKRRLQDRAVVEKAKGLLMRYNRWSEDRAYRWLREHSQRQQMRIGDLARQIVLTSPAYQEALENGR